MHGSIPLETVTTTTIESRAFADWDDAKGAEMGVSKILAAEKRNPRRSLRDNEIRGELARLVRICQRATVAADPQSRNRVVAHRIPGVRYVQTATQTAYELFFSLQSIDRGVPDMALLRSEQGEWTIAL